MASTSSYIICPLPDCDWSIKCPENFGKNFLSAICIVIYVMSLPFFLGQNTAVLYTSAECYFLQGCSVDCSFILVYRLVLSTALYTSEDLKI